jgi:hypothetical protein
MNDIYKEKYHELLGAAGPIHWSTKFGKNCRVGAYVVIEEGCE